jgi:hypothetical protein
VTIETAADAIEASKCALDRISKDSDVKCALAAVGCRWCATSVKPLLRMIRNYLEDPANTGSINSQRRGMLL